MNDAGQILTALGVFCAPGDVHELRILNTARGTVSGYFDDHAKMAEAAARWSGKAESVYATLNPVSPDLLARAANRVKEFARYTTADTDVLRRRLILIDFDPVRPAGISATDAEHQAAIERATMAHQWLIEQHDWRSTVLADSGNGGHILARIDLPNDDATRTLIERVLKAIHERWSDERIKVDRTTFNASRICTLYGTLKAKGDATPDRPHRVSRLITDPSDMEGLVTEAHIASVIDAGGAAPGPARAPAATGTGTRLVDLGASYDPGLTDGPFDMESFIARNTTLADVRPSQAYQGGTRWQLTCPFNPDHHAPDAALYVTGDGAAAFRCSHNSCQGNDWHALRRLLGDLPAEKRETSSFEPAKPKSRYERARELRKKRETVGEQLRSAGDLTVIETNGRHLRDVTQDALTALMETNDPPIVFVRGGELVRIVRDEKGAPAISSYDSAGIRHRLARIANFVSTSEDRGTVPVAPGATMIEDMLAFPSFDFLPPLETIASSPVVAPDGTLIVQPGYVEGARVYYHEIDSRLPGDLGETAPTPERVSAAKELLLTTLLGDFPFVDESSRAHALCALLQPFVRACIQGNTPLFLVDAPTQGTGKSLLAQTVAAVFLGRIPPSTPCPDRRNDEEWRKLLTTALIEGPSHVWFDNLKYRLDSASLAQALTSHSWHDRLLGANTSVTLPVRCTWLLTANNIELDADFPRRSVWIRLDSKIERPEDRDVNSFVVSDLEAFVITERPRIIAAVVTLLRAWLDAGRPEWQGQPVGSYVSWCRVMGGILETIGVSGFLQNREILYAKTNPDLERWYNFVEAWWEAHHETPVGVAELIAVAVECEIVPDQERGSKNLFGKRLRERVDSVVAGHVIAAAGEAHRAAQYQLRAKAGAEPARKPYADADDAPEIDVPVNQVNQNESFPLTREESRNGNGHSNARTSRVRGNLIHFHSPDSPIEKEEGSKEWEIGGFDA